MSLCMKHLLRDIVKDFGGLFVCFGKDDDFENFEKIENHLLPRQEADEERAAGVERGGRRRGGDFLKKSLPPNLESAF